MAVCEFNYTHVIIRRGGLVMIIGQIVHAFPTVWLEQLQVPR